MFVYTKKYTDIRNNDLLYKTHQKHQNTFEVLEKVEKEKRKFEKTQFFILLYL